MTASYFRPNAIGNYSFDDQNNVVFNKLDKLFDVAIMMDCSQCPIHPKLKTVFTDFAKKGSDTARAHGARPVFFMSWAYADKPEMTAQLAEAYTVAGNANDVLVIPAGLAFARAVSKQPELNLYAPDKRHPSLAGTYLASCVVFSALTGRSPVGRIFARVFVMAAVRTCEPISQQCRPARLKLCRLESLRAIDKAADLEAAMTAFAKAVSRAFLSTLDENETLKQIALFCAAGLLVSLLLLTTASI